MADALRADLSGGTMGSCAIPSRFPPWDLQDAVIFLGFHRYSALPADFDVNSCMDLMYNEGNLSMIKI
jgi:hypothetical protein